MTASTPDTAPPQTRADDQPTELAPTTAAVLGRYASTTASSARVLLTTVFGDALLPRGEAVSVGALIELAGPLGINDRNVRTTLQRLSSERLVTAERIGRRSFYRVHPEAVPTFVAANQRIYERPSVAWDGQWTMAVVDPNGDVDSRADLLQRLRWLGLAAAAPGVLASALVTPDQITAALADGAGLGGVLALTRAPVVSGTLLDDDGRRRFFDPAGHLDERYRAHLATFSPFDGDSLANTGPVDAFVLRTLAVDSWRRLALRAPDIPADLEPDNWPAAAAFELTASVLAAVRPGSDDHLDRVLAAHR